MIIKQTPSNKKKDLKTYKNNNCKHIKIYLIKQINYDVFFDIIRYNRFSNICLTEKKHIFLLSWKRVISISVK